MAPSQPTAAVAGVQLASRQQSSLVPFFQVVPSAARQLSTDWAPAAVVRAVARAVAAINIATLFNFFMVLLKGKIRSHAASIKLTPKMPITMSVLLIVPQSI
ncbi:MAG: hypothetical protein GW826_02645 [Rhodoferax sp.]|nr:hypothetical protein [Rhodoferax sp.]